MVKDVPNFINDVPNFVNDVPSGPKSVSKWSTVRFEVGNDLQSLLKAVQRNKWTIERKIGVLLAQGLEVSNFLKDVPRVPKSVSK